MCTADAVNECDTANGGCDQICMDTPSSFTCSCMTGFTLTNDGRTCVDDDECMAGTHDCQQQCVNTPGGFRCECDPGFQINADERTCSGMIHSILLGYWLLATFCFANYNII